jgi:hypothetical protein
MLAFVRLSDQPVLRHQKALWAASITAYILSFLSMAAAILGYFIEPFWPYLALV